MNSKSIISLLLDHRRVVLVVMVLGLLFVGAGAADLEESPEMDFFDGDPEEVQAQAHIHDTFSGTEANTTHLTVAITNDTGNVLERSSLLESLRYQQALRDDPSFNNTIADDGMFGIANAVAIAAMAEGEPLGLDTATDPADLPPLDAQIDQMEAMDEAEVEMIVAELLSPATPGDTSDQLLDLMPASYEPGTAHSDGRLLVITQETDGQVLSPPEISESIREAQVKAADLADTVDRDEYHLVGYGLMLAEEEESTTDSFALIGPIALLFVLVTLFIAYRDILDIALGMVGILLVLVWTFGAMGWLGIDFNIMMLATPVLLIGLSIDYCIHVIMRYREYADGIENRKAVDDAMRRGLGGLAPALTLVTLTAMLGFLSIHSSGVPLLTDFGVVTAIGILGSLGVFGVVIPLLKIELEYRLIDRGYDRSHRAFGTVGWIRTGLSTVVQTSLRHPWTIIAIVLAISSLGLAGGMHLEAEFASEDYIAEEAPAWANELPEPFAPGEYQVRDSLTHIFDHFQSPDQQIHFLVDDDLTDPATLQAVAAIEERATNTSVTFTRPTGEPAVRGPVGAMRDVAAMNDSFGETFNRADTTGDGIPDRNLTEVFSAFTEAAPHQADTLISINEDGSVTGHVTTVVHGTVSPTAIADEMQPIGEGVSDTVDVTVTGELIINELVQRQLSETLVFGLAVALAAILAVLLVAFRMTRGSFILGGVTMIPVLLGLSWILGGMYLAGLPFSFATALIGSIAIGLGVDYAIHMAERFSHELERTADTAVALENTVIGTGGALFGSAVTTAVGFGVMSFSLVPVMQQFGIVIAMAIVSAFVASVLVLPSLLVVWSRFRSNTGV